MSPEVLEASFGSETIRFSVVRRVRKTLSISVLPNQQVEVVAHLNDGLLGRGVLAAKVAVHVVGRSVARGPVIDDDHRTPLPRKL